MAVLTLSQEIERPVHDVFATIVDIGNFAACNPTIKTSRQITPGAPAPGTFGEWDLRGSGNVRQELQEFEPDRRVRIVPHMKAITGGHRFTLTDLGGRTRVHHELEMKPQGFFVLMAPMMKRTGQKNLSATADALNATSKAHTARPARDAA
jgi:carbon monoxide dehydrogenase subunit G